MQPPAMAVLNVAYPFAPVGPDPVGGAEQVVAALDARLVRDGHASVVLAACGSRALGQLVTIPPHAGWIDDAARTRTRGVYRDEIARICRDHPIELIHVHGHDCVPDLDVPVVATLHLPRPFYASEVLASPCAARICVSQTQRRTFSPDVAIEDVIENGVAVERYRPSARKERFVL